MIRFLPFLIFIGGAYLIFKVAYSKWRKIGIHEKIDEKKEVMAETIKAAQKVADKDDEKAYEKAKKKVEEFTK